MLDVSVPVPALPGLLVAVLVTAFACTGLGIVGLLLVRSFEVEARRGASLELA